MTIDENIKRYRLRKHMTQADLAKAIGSTLRMVQRYEAPEETSNSVIPSVPILRKIAKALDVNISDIIEDTNNKHDFPTINHFYNSLTEGFSETNMADTNKNKVKNILLFYMFKNIYNEYKMDEHTEMDAFDYYFSDSSFPQFLYDQIASIILGSTIQNLVQVKLGRNKPMVESKRKLEELNKNLDLDTLFTVFNYFDDNKKIYDLLQFTAEKMNEYNAEDDLGIPKRIHDMVDDFTETKGR